MINVEIFDFKKTHADDTLYQFATWHNLTPKLWMPNYTLEEKDVKETLIRIKNTDKNNLFLLAAYDNQTPIAFIWGERNKEKKDRVMILSLYVSDLYRNQNVATTLKGKFEFLCRESGIKHIDTTVSYNNHKMMELNQKMGYKAGMVTMSKSL